MSDDPCACLFNHEAMMGRLISLLRDNQNDCTDSDCTTGPLAPGAGGMSGNMLIIAMAWGLLAMFMFFLRPNSMRFNNNNRQSEGKPEALNNNNGSVSILNITKMHFRMSLQHQMLTKDVLFTKEAFNLFPPILPFFYANFLL